MKQALLHDVWLVLADAVKQRTPFTLMQLATVGEDGAPKIRTIVLRSFNEASTSLSFITDLRSPKVREITANPCVSLAGFDNERVVQLRIDGRAEIIEDETRRRDFWNALHPHTHILFRSALPPGTVLASPNEMETDDSDPATAYARFCLVEIVISHVERLDLSSEPHRRCSFRQGLHGWEGRWIVP